MTIYFMATQTIAGGTAPSDSNDGLDPIGFGITDATYVDSTKTLTKTGGFTSYVFTSGDYIAIKSGTGITPGLYQIASRVDANNITLTTSIGSDSAGGDIVTGTGPFAWGQIACETWAEGDDLRVCAGGVFTSTTQWTWSASTTSGSITNHNSIYGCNARGQDTLRGTATKVDMKRTSNAFLMYDGNATKNMDYVEFWNLNFKDSQVGVAVYSSSDGVTFTDCRFQNNTNYGFQGRTASQVIRFLRCEFDETGGASLGDGIGNALNSIGLWLFVDCSFHDNQRSGARVGNFCVFENCLFYDNLTGILFNMASSYHTLALHHCVIHGNSGDGVLVEAGTGEARLMMRNCILSGNGGFGLNLNTDQLTGEVIGPNNYYNNTAGEASTDGSTEVTGASLDTQSRKASIATDPGFKDLTDGSEDFTPTKAHASFSNGEVQTATGVLVARPTYLGAVPPSLLAGGDGVGGGGGGMLGG